MKFIPQSISGLTLIEPKIHRDTRGYFTETYKKDLLSYALRTLSGVPSLTPCAIKLLEIEKLIISATENKNLKTRRFIYFTQSAKIS